MALEHRAVPMHGMYWHEEPGPRGLCWWQYHHTIVHTWCWYGIPIWRAARRRDRPMYLLTRHISGGW